MPWNKIKWARGQGRCGFGQGLKGISDYDGFCPGLEFELVAENIFFIIFVKFFNDKYIFFASS